jgi:hypothetical protein
MRWAGSWGLLHGRRIGEGDAWRQLQLMLLVVMLQAVMLLLRHVREMLR